MVSEHTLCYLHPLNCIGTFFMAQPRVSHGECSTLESKVYFAVAGGESDPYPLGRVDGRCLNDELLALLVTEEGVLKPPNITVDSSISPLNSTSFCFTYFAALLLRYIHT